MDFELSEKVKHYLIIRMIKLWSKDINFLSNKAQVSDSENEVLQILYKIESNNAENQDYYIVDLNETELDLIEDFLTDLICEIGIGEDGEINQIGRYIDNLIDVFNTRN